MNSCVDLLSPPAWWCGLKSLDEQVSINANDVTTCVVVWIEILIAFCNATVSSVTTCVVVWIEIADLR